MNTQTPVGEAATATVSDDHKKLLERTKLLLADKLRNQFFVDLNVFGTRVNVALPANDQMALKKIEQDYDELMNLVISYQKLHEQIKSMS